MAKSYTYNSVVTLNIVDVPHHIAIDTTNILASYEVETTGFRLWNYNLSKKRIDINYNLFVREATHLNLSANVVKKQIAKEGNFNIKAIEFYEDNISVSYTLKDSKNVPIISNIEYEFSDGYNSLEALRLVPDSITVTGSIKELDKVFEVRTETKKITKVNQNLKGFIKLEKPNPNLKFSKNEVEYSLNIEKFSEKSIEVQIEVINIPEDLNLTIFPAKAKLSFLVSLNSFEKVTDLDFKIICDYNNRFDEEAVMIPNLVNFPKTIKNINLHTKKVDYLLVKI